MLESLGIGFIPAGSPQAKGRIERLWQTLQDRLVSELRLQGIATPEAAHAFLPAFRADYNRRVARPPARPRPAWRPLPRELPLLPGCRYPRRVAQDNTARLGLRGLPLPPGPRRRSWAGLRVERRALLDGRLVVLHDAHVLASLPSPGPAFVLRPRRGQRAATRRSRAAQPRAATGGRAGGGERHPTCSPSARPTRAHPWRTGSSRRSHELYRAWHG